MAFALIEIIRTRKESLGVIDLEDRAIEIAMNLCNYSITTGHRVDYEIVDMNGHLIYCTYPRKIDDDDDD